MENSKRSVLFTTHYQCDGKVGDRMMKGTWHKKLQRTVIDGAISNAIEQVTVPCGIVDGRWC